MPDDAPVTRTVRPFASACTVETSPERVCALWLVRAALIGPPTRLGVSEGSRTPDLQDHNLAL